MERSTKYIVACLELVSGTPQDLKGAYTILKRCFLHTSVKAHNPPQLDMAKAMKYFAALYWWEDLTSPPPDRPVTTHITAFSINNNVPMEAEVEDSVHRLRLNKAGDHRHIR